MMCVMCVTRHGMRHPSSGLKEEPVVYRWAPWEGGKNINNLKVGSPGVGLKTRVVIYIYAD
eukprot:jgi/Botrbrau1/12709/Bobra.67_1s0072.1